MRTIALIAAILTYWSPACVTNIVQAESGARPSVKAAGGPSGTKPEDGKRKRKVKKAAATRPDKPRQLLYKDDFDGDLSQWVIEQAPGGAVRLKDEQLDIDDAKGCTVWFKEKLTGLIAIEYEATMIKQKGRSHDRVSDLNCFWMAIDPKHPKDIFSNKKRKGSFKNYHSLRLYYVGYGANNNNTTRFRRYPGGGARPCLPEHDRRDKKFMHTPNKTLKIRIIADGGRIQYLRDGEIVFDVIDKEPFTKGWFGFRTVRNHMRIDNFRVYSLARPKKG